MIRQSARWALLTHGLTSALGITVALAVATPARAALDVVTTTEDLAALVREVGGDRVKVQALARGYQDPHFVEPKPSFIMKLHGADLLVVVGRELEAGWLPALARQSRNGRILPGGDRHLDASLTAEILDVPTGPITRAMGDVHPLGNPHYWLDPANGRRVADAIRVAMTSIDSESADYFRARYDDFDRRLADAEARWDARLAAHRGDRIVTYHRSWSNLCKRFGLEVIGYVEPRPGIPPSPGHVLDLIRAIEREKVEVIVVEPYFDLKTPRKIADQSGATLLILLPSVGGEKDVTDYISLFDHNVEKLAAALEHERVQ
jgi:ABC-type Zn uptake system ZnuABC Zn-binding protein ZnuA